MHDDDEYDDDDDLFSPPPMMMQNKRMESMNLEDGRHHGGKGGGGLRRISLPIYSAHGIVTKEQKSLRRVSTSAAEIQQQQQQQHSNNKQRQRRTRSVQLKNGLIHEEEETQQQQQQQDDDSDALPSPPAKKHDDQHLLGMIHGVYVPVLENMWGVLIFLRFFYIVGNAGVFETLGIVAISFFAALLTTFSLSAIATNGPIDHGGAYFIISRAVGPRVGAAIGLVYFLGVSLLAVLEALGAVEMLLFTAPVLSFTSANRAWGSIFIALLFTMVYAGVRMVAKFGILFAIIVVLTLISYYVGLGVAPNARAPCEVTGLQWSTLQGNLYPAYNTEQSFATMLTLFFPCFTGFLSGANRSMSLKDPTKAIPRGTIAAVVTSLVVYTSFFMLWASVAPRQYLTWGSTTRNDLWPGSQGRYPEGTTRADVCPNLSEDSLAFAPAPGGDFVDVFDDAYFGVRRLARRLLASAGSSDSLYVITDIVWPLPIVTQIGVIIASLAQAMQCLVVSPRMLQAIAQDGTIPVLKPLRVMGGKFNDEPRRALICTGIICLLGVQIGKLDPVAPMLSVCFLVCYSALNLSTAIHSYTHSPDWRPTFPIRHWSVSMLGFLLCAALAFVINWMYSLILMFAVLVISVYVAWCDVAVSWGTGFGGLQLKLALRWATHRQHQLHTTGTHISQWRPQLLIIRRPDETRTALRKQRLLEVAYQLKHGGGLTCLASIMEGDATDPDSRAMLAKVKRNLERELYLIREEETSSYSPFVRSGPKNDKNYNGGGGNDDGDDDDDDERRRTTHRVVDMTMSDDAAPSSCCDDDDDDMKDVEEERRRTCCHRPSWCSWCNFDIRHWSHCCRAWLQRSRTGVRKTIQMGGGKKQRVVKIAGFVQAVIVADWRVGLTAALQAIGLGALEPNMVLTSLSTTAAASSGGGGGGGGNGDGGDHTPSSGGADGKIHLGSLLRISANVGKVACVVHSLGAWPTNARQLSEEWKTSRRDISGDDDGVGPSSETIDVWWVNHDGGLLLLLAHLLRRDNVWRKCKLRVFCIVNAVTDPEQNDAFTNAMKKELDDSRIKADTVTVVSLAREECFAILHDVDRASSCVSEFGSDDDDEDYQRLGTINEMMIPTTAAAAADESGGGGGGGGAQPTNRESCVSITASRGGGGGGGGDTQRRVTSTAVNLNLLSSCRTMRDTSLSRRMSTLLRTLIAQSSARQRSSSSTGEARTTTCDDAAPSSPIDDSDDAGVSGGDDDDDNDAHVPFHVQATTLHQAIQRHSRRASLVLINLPGPSMALRDDPTGSSSSPPQSDAKETDLAYVQFMETVVGMGTGQQPLRRAMLVHGTGQEHISNIS